MVGWAFFQARLKSDFFITGNIILDTYASNDPKIKAMIFGAVGTTLLIIFVNFLMGYSIPMREKKEPEKIVVNEVGGKKFVSINTLLMMKGHEQETLIGVRFTTKLIYDGIFVKGTPEGINHVFPLPNEVDENMTDSRIIVQTNQALYYLYCPDCKNEGESN